MAPHAAPAGDSVVAQTAAMSTRHRLKGPPLHSFAWPLASALALAACQAGSDGVSAPPAATFVGLGILPGYSSSRALAVAGDGSVVAGTASTVSGMKQAFTWNAQQGSAALGFAPTGTNSAAAAVSADGSVILVNGDSAVAPPTPSAVFRWTREAGFVRLASPDNSTLCSGAGVSGDGSVIVGTCLRYNGEAFRWLADAAPIGLGRFGGGSDQTSSAAAISANGSLVVGAGHPVLTGALAWDATGIATILGKLPTDASAVATATSRDGSVVVGVSLDSAGNAHAFRWTRQAGMEALGALPDGISGSVAAGASGDGTRIVGWGAAASAGEVALVWDAAHGWRSLAAALRADHRMELPGWKLERATAISDDGHDIVGYGTNPQGQTEAWRLLLPR